MMTQICGDVGDGKTALAVKLALDCMIGDYASSRINEIEKLCATAARLGKHFTPPIGHSVFSDIKIKLDRPLRPRIRNHAVTGWQIGFPNKHFETKFIPPYSDVFLDEAQTIYDSILAQNRIRPEVLSYYAWHRHPWMNFYFTCQRPISIIKSVRGLVERFVFPKIRPLDDRGKIVKEGDDRKIVKVIWDCVEFNNMNAAIAYADGKDDTGGKKTKYVHDGDIFKNYDSHARLKVYLDGYEGYDFGDVCKNDDFALSDIIAPPGFYLGD